MERKIKTPLRDYLKFVFVPFVFLILLLVCLSGNIVRFPDEVEYHQLGISLASGNGFTLENGESSTLRPPGYAYLLSLVYRIHATPVSAKLFNAIIITLSAWGMCRISKNLLPVLFLCAYPVMLFTTTTLYPVILSGLLLFLILIRLCKLERSLRSVISAGILLGLLILNTPSFMLTSPILAWILFRSGSGKIQHRIANVALFTICTLIMVLPWTWRNYNVTGKFIMVSANSGLNLYLGNSPNAGPNTGVNVDRPEILEAVQGLNEIDTDRYYGDMALEWIRTHPGDALKLYSGKVLNYFNFRNQLATESQSSKLKDLVMFASWYPLLGLFVVRLFFTKNYPLSPLEKAIYLLVISNVFLSAIFFTRIRFRLPFDQLMILANAIFVGQLLQNQRFFTYKPLTKP